MADSDDNGILVMYWDDSYRGDKYGTSNSLYAVPRWFNDQMSSFHLQVGYSAIFYFDVQFQYPAFSSGNMDHGLPKLDNDCPWVGDQFNDKVSSVKLFDTNGVEISARDAWGDADPTPYNHQ